jgi:hypothetical protein
MLEHNSSPQKSLFDEQDKDKKIKHFLQAVPYLTFSDTGLKNIAARFGITLEEMRERIKEFEAKEGRNNV